MAVSNFSLSLFEYLAKEIFKKLNGTRLTGISIMTVVLVIGRIRVLRTPFIVIKSKVCKFVRQLRFAG